MLEALLNTTPVPWLQKLAEFGERRQEVLAGNLANIDTPGYRTRDLPLAEFQQALGAALRAKPHASPLAANGAPPALAAELFPRRLFQAVEVPSGQVTFQDGGNRSIEREIMEMTKNVLMQTYAVELMNAHMHMLRMAVDGRAAA